MSLRCGFLVIITAITWLSGCAHEPSAPISAILEVHLATTAQDDGAVLFTISGGPVDSVDAPGYTRYTARVDENTTRVIVAGDLGPGVIARIHVGDDRSVSQYSATLNQVAARSYVQHDVASYALSLEP